MTAAGEDRYEHSRRALSARVLEETVILDLELDRYTRLNGSAGILWAELEEPRSVSELARALEARYGIGRERAEADAAAFVERLLDRELLEPHEAT